MTRPPLSTGLLLLSALGASACSDGQLLPPEVDAPAYARISAPAGASIGPVGEVEPVLSLEAADAEFPEGVALDKRGNLYVTLAPLGQVLRVTPDGTATVLATLDPAPAGPGALGLVTDPQGHVYVAVASFNPATHGIHLIGPDGGSTRLAGSEAIGFPNGLALDQHGDLYVTDSSGGAVWRIPSGGSAEPWISDPLLEGNGSFGLGVPIGANGVAVFGDVLWVANTEEGLLVRIPIERGGSAGSPTVFAEGPELVGLDGLALDVHGRVYGAVNVQNAILRIDPTDGSTAALVEDGKGLDFPAALAFGTGRGDRKTIFVTNFALLDDPANPTPPGPGVVKLDVGTPGLPTP